MFCTNCGSKNNDDAAFCANCGTSMQDTSGLGVFTASESNPVNQVPLCNEPAYDYSMPSKQKKSLSKNKILIIVSICIVILVAAAIGFFAYLQAKKSEAEHATTQVQFAFSYSGDTTNEPVGIPLLIEGTDLDGSHTKEQLLATPTGGTLELLAGSYTISVDGMPVSNNGVVYEVEGESIQSLDIPVPSGDKEAPKAIIPDLNYSFAPVAIDKVTDQQIEGIRDWMNAYGVDTSEINSIISAVTDRRDTEVARIKLEKEKKEALASNPSSVYGTNLNQNAPAAQLTGTVCVKYFAVSNFDMPDARGDVCYLQLPKSVKLLGTQYDGMAASRVILPESLSSYKGQVVTISSHFSGRATASIKEAPCSPIWAYDAIIVRTFK